MPDEKVLRRPEFAEGIPIALGDGREWHFRRPVIARLYPEVSADGQVTATADYGPEYTGLVDALESAEKGLPQIEALMRVAVYLLRLNYDLAPADFRSLLPYVPGDDSNESMWLRVAAVVVGSTGPKPSAGGSAAPSSPTASTPPA